MSGNKESAKTRLAKGVEVIQQFQKNLEATPGVYRMYNAAGDILYIGKARNLKARVASYTRPDVLPTRTRRMIAETIRMETTTTHTEAEALLLEALLIKEHLPRYNVLLRDDKSFPFIHLSGGHDFPRMEKHRGAREGKGTYYGPYMYGSLAVDETINALQRAFFIRNCSDNIFAARKRPCLQYHIKRCSAPCVNYISKEDYASYVKQAKDFLAGKSAEIQEQLSREMRQASDDKDYETAAVLRDRIRALSFIQSKQKVFISGLGDADIVGLYRKGGRASILIFFYRQDSNMGQYAVYPDHTEEETDEEILSAFLPQFYENKPVPSQIIASHNVAEKSLIEKALTIKAGRKISIHVPERGKLKELTQEAVKNAEQSLSQRMLERANQQELLGLVAERFTLSSPPRRIEVYDNSHIQGTNAVGAMIVANEEGFNKKAYRKFNIRLEDLPASRENLGKGDDYGMLEQVLRRRFSRAIAEDPERTSGNWPDLVLIDGGLGQLNTARNVMAELGILDIPLVAIAKGPDRNAGKERFFTIDRDAFSLEAKDPALYFLQRLRDEAHRFAIGGHRKRRQIEMGRSELDQIPGIGAFRKRALLNHFGSVIGIKKAGVADLEVVKGISKSIAQKIYNHFHSGT